MLLTLYLEDKLEPGRVTELLRDLQKHRKQPIWDDGYISALQARNDGDPELGRHIQRLSSALKPGDPRMGLLNSAFPAQMNPS